MESSTRQEVIITNDMLKAIFDGGSLTFDEFCARLDGTPPDELFVPKADYELLSDSYNQLKNATADFDPDWAEKAAKIVFDGALDCALSLTDAHDKSFVKQLLDLDSLEYDNGSVKGLDEQLERIRAEHGFLFENQANAPLFSAASSGRTVPSAEESKNTQTNSVLRAVFGRK